MPYRHVYYFLKVAYHFCDHVLCPTYMFVPVTMILMFLFICGPLAVTMIRLFFFIFEWY